MLAKFEVITDRRFTEVIGCQPSGGRVRERPRKSSVTINDFGSPWRGVDESRRVKAVEL